MAKGDDIRRRKLNKANRKKLQKDSSAVSARIASIIAAKKRRHSGKRRKCQGMCFSLPTLEDPFNDRHANDISVKPTKKHVPARENVKTLAKREDDLERKKTSVSDQVSIDHKDSKRLKMRKSVKIKNLICTDNIEQENFSWVGKGKLKLLAEHEVVDDQKISEKFGAPSKFLVLCLKSIHDSLLGEGLLNVDEDKPLFVYSWGVEFWKSFAVGKDILETSGSSTTLQQIAWVASTAADTIASKEKEGLSFSSPFLLYLVPSQSHAAKVRSVCKPLKALGIHTVSLHPGASLDHQIHGLKSCEPEFLVATPERLWELVSLKAIDISGVSFLVVEGVAANTEGCCPDVVKYIRQSMSGTPRTVVFHGCSSGSCVEAVQSLLKEPIHRLSLDDLIKSQDVGIGQ
ncbi:hypothetical protein Ancab_023778 [Ancistrocladus abbreviatus]